MTMDQVPRIREYFQYGYFRRVRKEAAIITAELPSLDGVFGRIPTLCVLKFNSRKGLKTLTDVQNHPPKYQ
ncbi:hypothetical protein [Roseibium sp.]|uniref:hypothetical protein n=1 Tax=Roseibium sp. TaxID=1936156 RepID=UPI003A9803B0